MVGRDRAGTGWRAVAAELGGDAAFINAETETSGAEAAGLLAALVVLVVAFGTIVAALVPIALALVAVAAGLGGIALLANAMDVSTAAPTIGAMIGLGVGIDYALFIMARYRENRAAGQDNPTALSNAMGSSGSAVLLAGGTVVVAMAALVLTGLGFLASIGLSTSLVVLLAVATALTLLPALLSLLGDRIDAGRLVGRRRPVKPAEDTAWWRFAHRVSGRPWPYLLVASAVLLALAAPALRMETGFPDAGDDATSTTHRRAYDLLARASARASTPRCCSSPTCAAPAWTPRPSPRWPSASPPTPASPWSVEPRTSPAGDTVVLPTIPTTAPADAETSETLAARPRPRPRQRRRVGPDRHDRRPHRAARRHPADLHRRDPGRVVPAADGGVPLHRGAAEGRRDEPAVDRRRVRRRGRRVPVGVARRTCSTWTGRS